MPVSVLIIDAYEAHRRVVVEFLHNFRPDLRIEQYDVSKGIPDGQFDWSRYDLILMESRLGNSDGLEWLEGLRNVEGLPPVVFLSSQNNVDIAVGAMKLGARDFVLKKGVKASRLRRLFTEFLPPVEPTSDLMPDLKPLPSDYETSRYKVPVNDNAQHIAAADTLVSTAQDDDYWDQQTQILYHLPKK